MHVLDKSPRFPVKTAGPELVIEIQFALFFIFIFFIQWSPINPIKEKGQQTDLDTEIAMVICLFVFIQPQHMVAHPPQCSPPPIWLKLTGKRAMNILFFFLLASHIKRWQLYHSIAANLCLVPESHISPGWQNCYYSYTFGHMWPHCRAQWCSNMLRSLFYLHFVYVILELFPCWV